MGNRFFNVDCFACKEVGKGILKCNALQDSDCRGCHFFRTMEDYQKNVEPLRHKI